MVVLVFHPFRVSAEEIRALGFQGWLIPIVGKAGTGLAAPSPHPAGVGQPELLRFDDQQSIFVHSRLLFRERDGVVL